MSELSHACCINVADAPLKLFSLLKGQLQPCRDCRQRKIIDTMVKQFKSKQPRWWIVNGAVVVPIWVLERLRRDLNSIG